MLSSPILRTSILRKTYRKQDATWEGVAPIDAPAFPSLEIPRGKVVAVIGGSGSGKSTLLNLLAGLMQPDNLPSATSDAQKPSIVVHFEGREPVEIVGAPNNMPRERVGFIFQDGYLLANMTVGLNIALPSLSHGQTLSRQDVDGLLTSLSLVTDYRTKRAWQLSGGEAQRVSVARAVAHNPELVFADEPTSNLDQVRSEELMAELAEWAHRGQRTVIWVTHDLALAYHHADVFLVLKKGELGAGELREKPKDLATLQSWVLDDLHSRGDKPRLSGGPGVAGRARAPAFALPLKMAASEIFSRQAALENVTTQQPLSERLADADRGKARLPGAKLLMSLVRAFNDWNGLMFTTVSFLLGLVTILAVLVVRADYTASLNNPLNCHVLVAGHLGADNAVNHDGLAGLSARKWEEERRKQEEKKTGRRWKAAPGPEEETAKGLPIPASCTEGAAAFGRRDTQEWNIGITKGGQCERTGVAVRMLVTYPNEPMLSRVNIVSTGSHNTGPKTLAAQFAEDGFFPRASDIYLTEYAVKQIHHNARDWDGANICLDELDERDRNFTVKAVVDDLPSPVRFKYDAFVTEKSYLSVNSDKASDPYTQIAVYFDPYYADEFKAYLKQNDYFYSEDNLRRLDEIARAMWERIAQLSGLALALAVVFGLFYYNWIDAYLTQNSRSFAVAKSFGLRGKVFFLQILIRLSLHILIVAVVAALLVAIAAAGRYLGLFSLSISLRVVMVSGGAAILAIVIVSFSAASICAVRWWACNRYVAQTLASG